MRKSLFASFTALLLTTACGVDPNDPSTDEQVAAEAATAAGTGFIQSVSYSGTGCPSGSATTGISLDKQAATSVFSAFVAPVNPSGSKVTRNCVATMKLSVPRGWSYALNSADVRGFASLEAGVTASRQSVYAISGGATHVAPATRVRGPISDDYNQADIGPNAPGPWSPCGGGQTLWIATQTDVTGRGTGQFTVDTIDTELKWRRCK